MTTKANRQKQALAQIESILKEVKVLNQLLEQRYDRIAKIKEEYSDVLEPKKSGGE